MARFKIDENDNFEVLETKKTKRVFSSCSIDSGIHLSSQVESLLDKVEEKGKLVLETCRWPTESADLILKVDESLFPVHRMILWESSELFRSILETITVTSEEEFDMITLKGVNANDVEDILPFFYDKYHPIDELDVLDVLRMAEFFEAAKVIKQCELFLILLENVHPLDLLKIAKKYNLKDLQENAIERASKLAKIAQCSDFDDLDLSIQNDILIRLIKRHVCYRDGTC